MLAGINHGVFTDADDAVAACVRVRDRIELDRAWGRVSDEGYARFRHLYPTLRGLP